MVRWLEAFPVPRESPAHRVRYLRFYSGGAVPKLFEYTPWFENAKVFFLGQCGDQSWISSFRGLPQSVTSLVINTDTIAPLQIQKIMAQLPNLDDLIVLDMGYVPQRQTKGRWLGPERP